MNAQSLRELIDELLETEGEFGVQAQLDQVATQLQQLMGNPTEQSYQLNYAKALDRLRDAVEGMASSFSPAKVKIAEEIGADKYFLSDLPNELQQLTAANPLTPAVISGHLASKIKKRRAFIDTLTALQGGLERVGITPNIPEPGTAEIGILIPRPLFHNHLDEFAKELSVLNNIIRVFSEIATGKCQAAEVQQISTSDPTIFLGMDADTIKLIGHSVTWALGTLTSIFTLKKLREDAAKTKLYTEAEIKSMFDDKAKALVEQAVEERTKEIVANSHSKSRNNELEPGVKWALETIFAKVERGMTVELRFLPPPPPAEGETATPTTKKKAATFDSLAEISQQLSFPELTDHPVLRIPPPEPPKATKPK